MNDQKKPNQSTPYVYLPDNKKSLDSLIKSKKGGGGFVFCIAVGCVFAVIGTLAMFGSDNFATSLAGAMGLFSGAILVGIGILINKIEESTAVSLYMAYRKQEEIEAAKQAREAEKKKQEAANALDDLMAGNKTDGKL